MAALTGFVDDEISWDKAKEIIDSGDIGKLGRSRPVLADYAKRSAQIKQEYFSIKDYVQIRFLGFPSTEVDVEVPDENNTTKIIKKKQAIPTNPSPISSALYLNDFPYFFPANVEHLILWCAKPLSNEEVAEILPGHLKERYGDAKIEYQQFTNTVALQSIRDVFHVHILVRKLSRTNKQ